MTDVVSNYTVAMEDLNLISAPRCFSVETEQLQQRGFGKHLH